jgi:hypothetical protein
MITDVLFSTLSSISLPILELWQKSIHRASFVETPLKHYWPQAVSDFKFVIQGAVLGKGCSGELLAQAIVEHHAHWGNHGRSFITVHPVPPLLLKHAVFAV